MPRLSALLAATMLAAIAAGVAFRGLDRPATCDAHGLVNPGVACNRETDVTAAGYAHLEREIRTYLRGRRAAGKLVNAAIHVKALRDGPTLSIDEYAPFAPASLLKLPIVIAFFRFRENDPGLFETRILYDRTGVTHYDIPEQVEISHAPLKPGEHYTIEALLRATIAHSDNLAYYLLLEHGNHVVPDGPARLRHTFREIGIVDPQTFEDRTLSVRAYGRIFRMLYNASFLSVADSEMLLSWLAQSRYDKGLAAGVPATVRVGNKFGERVSSDGTKQLHDCGIVFLDEHPYSLCVMTEGHDFAELEAVIREVSRKVFATTSGRDADERHAARDVAGRNG